MSGPSTSNIFPPNASNYGVNPPPPVSHNPGATYPYGLMPSVPPPPNPKTIMQQVGRALLQWNLRLKDTLGSDLLSSVVRWNLYLIKDTVTLGPGLLSLVGRLCYTKIRCF